MKIGDRVYINHDRAILFKPKYTKFVELMKMFDPGTGFVIIDIDSTHAILDNSYLDMRQKVRSHPDCEITSIKNRVRLDLLIPHKKIEFAQQLEKL